MFAQSTGRSQGGEDFLGQYM